MSKSSSNGSGVLGGVVFGIVLLIAMIPKPVWIAVGAIIAGSVLIWVLARLAGAVEKHRAAAKERARVKAAEQAAADKKERESKARREKQRRIDTLGKENAATVDSALVAINAVAASEAARAGWLGDVDFTDDVRGISASFEKAHSLRVVIKRLSALDRPNADDRRMLAEARTTAANLERDAIERVALIERCATEAKLIDETLRAERADARVAEQRADLHAQLGAMLYGIEATRDAKPADSTASAVIARVEAYREIRTQVRRASDSGPR